MTHEGAQDFFSHALGAAIRHEESAEGVKNFTWQKFVQMQPFRALVQRALIVGLGRLADFVKRHKVKSSIRRMSKANVR